MTMGLLLFEVFRLILQVLRLSLALSPAAFPLLMLGQVLVYCPYAILTQIVWDRDRFFGFLFQLLQFQPVFCLPVRLLK